MPSNHDLLQGIEHLSLSAHCKFGKHLANAAHLETHHSMTGIVFIVLD